MGDDLRAKFSGLYAGLHTNNNDNADNDNASNQSVSDFDIDDDEDDDVDIRFLDENDNDNDYDIIKPVATMTTATAADDWRSRACSSSSRAQSSAARGVMRYESNGARNISENSPRSCGSSSASTCSPPPSPPPPPSERYGEEQNRNVVGVRAFHERPDEISSDADTIEPEPTTTTQEQDEVDLRSPPPLPSQCDIDLGAVGRRGRGRTTRTKPSHSLRKPNAFDEQQSRTTATANVNSNITPKTKSKLKSKPQTKKKRVYSHAPDSDSGDDDHGRTPSNARNNDNDNDINKPLIINVDNSSASCSSSDDTLPPPSPSTLARVHSSVSANLMNEATIRPQIIDPDNAATHDAENHHRARTAYPKFKERQFRFKGVTGDKLDSDLHLSSLGSNGNKKKKKKPFDLPPTTGTLPKTIASYLSKYQREGVMFLYRLFERQRGGLLADAMGLGKTVQSIVFLGAAYSIWDFENRPRDFDVRVLVVAPASVRQNWKREFETWSPFRVALYDFQSQAQISRDICDKKVDVVITSERPVIDHTGFFENPLAKYEDDNDDMPRNTKKKWTWHVVIIDEIHVAKNKRTKIFEALKKVPRVCAFGLTGTAIQNNLKELYHVLSIVVPEDCRPAYKPFKLRFIDVIDRGSKKNAAAHLRNLSNDRIFELRQFLSKHIVRRPKCILDDKLPGKTEYCVLMRMQRNGVQAHMYKRFQHSYDVKMLRDLQHPCDCGSGQLSRECCHRYPTNEDDLKRAPIWRSKHPDNKPCEKCPRCICLPVQHYSRWIATHAFIGFPGDDEKDFEKAVLRRDVMEYYLGEEYASLLKQPLERQECDLTVSCKLTAALNLIRAYKKTGHKTIIFYESLKLGAILKRWATNKGIMFESIDGSVKKDRRQDIVDRFNDDVSCSVFFISKKAGSTGLNIASADRVLIFEPCWNPMYDLQAGDRAHRLGQTRTVEIIRLVIEHTIEHYVFKNAMAKTQLSSAVLDNTKEEWRVSEEELGSMYAMLGPGDNDEFMTDGKPTSQNNESTPASDGDHVDFRILPADLVPDNDVELYAAKKKEMKKKRKEEKEEKRKRKLKDKKNGRKRRVEDDKFIEYGDDAYRGEVDDEGGEGESFDILGKDQVMCALDVDLDCGGDGLDWIPPTPTGTHKNESSNNKWKRNQNSLKDHGSSKDHGDSTDLLSEVDSTSSSSDDGDDGDDRSNDDAAVGMDIDADDDDGAVGESQALVAAVGGGKRMVMTSTSARKTRKQVLGRACKLADGGGINAAGANDVNLDDVDTKWGRRRNQNTQDSATQQDLFPDTPDAGDVDMGDDDDDDKGGKPVGFDFNLVSDDDEDGFVHSSEFADAGSASARRTENAAVRQQELKKQQRRKAYEKELLASSTTGLRYRPKAMSKVKQNPVVPLGDTDDIIDSSADEDHERGAGRQPLRTARNITIAKPSVSFAEKRAQGTTSSGNQNSRNRALGNARSQTGGHGHGLVSNSAGIKKSGDDKSKKKKVVEPPKKPVSVFAARARVRR